MGYRSQIIIGIDKSVWDYHKGRSTAPSALIEEEEHTHIQLFDDNPKDIWKAIFFHLDDWKWYESYPDVEEITDWFSIIEKEEEMKQLIRPKVTSQWGPRNSAKNYIDERPPYGFIRTGEDNDDIEELGDPSHFEISVSIEIASPMDY